MTRQTTHWKRVTTGHVWFVAPIERNSSTMTTPTRKTFRRAVAPILKSTEEQIAEWEAQGQTVRYAPFTTYEVARRLGIGESTLRAHRKNGTGPEFYKVGRSVYYEREAVEKWLADQRAKSEAQNNGRKLVSMTADQLSPLLRGVAQVAVEAARQEPSPSEHELREQMHDRIANIFGSENVSALQGWGVDPVPVGFGQAAGGGQ